jgi:hypothetical protein
MLVGIDVIERDPAGAKRFELRLDLGADLAPHRAPCRDGEAESRHVGAKASPRIDKIGHTLGRQFRQAFDQHDMQADAQSRQPPGARDRVLRGGTCDHEACGGEDAVLMRRLDGLIDLGSEPEIVGGDDELLQCAGSPRWRRKRKNSTPSRSRRFIISGLMIISPTIEAILGARK